MASDIISEIRNKYFLITIIAITVFSIAFFFDIVTFRIGSLIFLLITYLFYITKRKADDKWLNFSNWTYFFLILLLLVTYIATSVQEFHIAIPIFVCIPLILLISLLIQQLSNLWESKNIIWLVISYIFLIFLAIIIFGYIFNIVAISEGHELKWVINNSNLSDIWDYIYFSAQTFYSINFGDIVPLGYSRMIAIIEAIFSTIVHIIILGMVIIKLTEQRKK